jgi:hypothetical protein
MIPIASPQILTPVTHFFAFLTAPDHFTFPADVYILISRLFSLSPCFLSRLPCILFSVSLILHFLTARILLNFLDLRLGLGLIGHHIPGLGIFGGRFFGDVQISLFIGPGVESVS